MIQPSNDPPPRPPRLPAVVWWGLGLAVCVALSVGGHGLLLWLAAVLDLSPERVGAMMDGRLFVIVLALYILLLAIPFVPSTELGLFLLAVFGAKAALPVYGATVAALILSFLIGRAVPVPRLVAGLRAMGLHRAAALLASGSPLTVLDAPSDGPRTVLSRVLRYRCVALGLLFNTPGNSLIGGGGGIALAVGASRLLSVAQFVATVLIAVAPIPVLVLIAAGVVD